MLLSCLFDKCQYLFLLFYMTDVLLDVILKKNVDVFEIYVGPIPSY